uniref:Uncharacterized protein n=1 Tax=Sphaerodactylus townsendi TaxID=933632 RepID=A0ACB8ENE9_9SAUR
MTAPPPRPPQPFRLSASRKPHVANFQCASKVNRGSRPQGTPPSGHASPSQARLLGSKSPWSPGGLTRISSVPRNGNFQPPRPWMGKSGGISDFRVLVLGTKAFGLSQSREDTIPPLLLTSKLLTASRIMSYTYDNTVSRGDVEDPSNVPHSTLDRVVS